MCCKFKIGDEVVYTIGFTECEGGIISGIFPDEAVIVVNEFLVTTVPLEDLTLNRSRK